MRWQFSTIASPNSELKNEFPVHTGKFWLSIKINHIDLKIFSSHLMFFVENKVRSYDLLHHAGKLRENHNAIYY